MELRRASAALCFLIIGCSAARGAKEGSGVVPPAPVVLAALPPPDREPSAAGIEPEPAAPSLEPTRFYRGDWESPDVLLVAYDEDWREPLATLIESALTEVEVYVVAGSDDLADPGFSEWLERHGAGVLPASHDTPWIRDYGPLQVIEPTGQVKWLDFRYSEERPFDDTVPIELAMHLGADIEPQALWLDGGALVSNGAGLCAMTEDSLGELGIDEGDDDAFDQFLVTVGCDVMAILPALPREETGHADVIAQFLDEDLVAIAEADDSTPLDVAASLDEAVVTIEESARSLGQSLRVVRLPLAARGEHFYSYVNGTRLPMRYLVPSFDATPHLESIVHRRLREVMPDVTLVPIVADAMVARGGAIHCITLGLSARARQRSEGS